MIKLHSEEPCYSCPSPNIILAIIRMTVKLAGCVERGEEKENAFEILLEKPEG